ncbi:MAG: hypothetical protein DI536_34380 [Archangium gephyra]|uniref:Uncharacterized protein n=1 Tax=Archangium gephyra TaxID=48 RepID=A0A2W5SN42_9BACT|nr:MAG: hypothetical protein DI536_34380 [Archangium gephyra]
MDAQPFRCLALQLNSGNFYVAWLRRWREKEPHDVVEGSAESTRNEFEFLPSRRLFIHPLHELFFLNAKDLRNSGGLSSREREHIGAPALKLFLCER